MLVSGKSITLEHDLETLVRNQDQFYCSYSSFMFQNIKQEDAHSILGH